jgi:hypothetical protein
MVSVIIWRRRDPVLALAALLAWASAYEILYAGTGTFMHGWAVPPYVWMTAAIAGWVVLAHVLGLILNRWVLVALALVWLLWVATGFESNVPSGLTTNGLSRPFSWAAEVYNELSKTLLALAYLLAALGPSVRTPVLRINAASSTAHAHHDPAHQHHITD